jgi:hypothetical protein
MDTPDVVSATFSMHYDKDLDIRILHYFVLMVDGNTFNHSHDVDNGDWWALKSRGDFVSTYHEIATDDLVEQIRRYYGDRES